MNFSGQYLQLNDHRIFYYTLGAGPPILFIHGHRSDALRVKDFLYFLSRYGRVYAPDLPGCGQSSPYPDRWHSLDAYAQTLTQFCQQLDLNELTLGGVSLGGMISLLLYPQIKQRVKRVMLLVTPTNINFFKWKFRKHHYYRQLIPLAVKSKILPQIGDKFIQHDGFMYFVQKHKFDPADRKKEIIEYETKQWRKMGFSVWLQTAYEVLSWKIDPDRVQVEAPTLIAETEDSQFYDTQKTLEVLKKIAPRHQVIEIPWQKHVPKGEVAADIFETFQSPISGFFEE